MPRQQRIKCDSGYYHIMLRGNEKRNIFLDETDKARFIDIIQTKKYEKNFYLHAYCLMDNHVHLMISEGAENIATIMKRINVSYVSYFNKKYQRVGHLFQDRFRSEIIENESYLLSLARYIHQNPVKANIVKSPDKYKWSSYNSYLGETRGISELVDKEIIFNQFSEDLLKAKNQYIEFMNEKNNESFMDLSDTEELPDEQEAKIIYQKLLTKYGMGADGGMNTIIYNELITEFRQITKLSMRKIAAIANTNKDKINFILKKSH